MKSPLTLAMASILVVVCHAGTGWAQVGLLEENFDDNSNGWSLDPEWQIGAALESSGHNQGNPDPDFDASGIVGGGLAGVVIGGNAETVVHDFRYLTSPPVDTTSLTSVELSYSRWLNSDYQPYMTNRVEVFDGTQWVILWETAGSPGVYDDAWTYEAFDIGAYSNAALQVRFGFSIGSSGVYTVSQWNLDNVRIGPQRTTLQESFDDNSNGWSLDPEWQIGAALESSGHNQGNPDPDFDASGIVGGGLAGVVIGGNAETVVHDFRYLTSPPVDTTSLTSVELSYSRWLNSDYQPYMTNRVEVFDGTQWVILWETAGSPGVYDDAWTYEAFDIGAYSNAALQVRFGFSIGSSGVYTVSQWNLDNVRIGPQRTTLQESFDDNSNGWSLDPEWQIGAALASTGHNQGNPDPDSDADGVFGGGLAGVVIGGNAETVIHDFYYLTSPPIDTTSLSAVELSYDRWLNSDYQPYMTNRVEVHDGVQWVVLWETAGSPGVYDDSWTTHSFDITAFSNAALQVRFGFAIGSSGVYTVSQWNLDNVRVGPKIIGTFEESFDDNSNGWSAGPEWEIGSALESAGQNQGNPDPASDAEGVLGGGLAGVVIGGNAETVIHDFYYLTSPPIDTTSLSAVELSYDRWLNSDYQPYMTNRVEVHDGVQWVVLWETAGSPGVYDDSWTTHSFDITAFSNASLQVRFGFAIGSSGVYTVSQWNLDNVRVGDPPGGTPFIRGDVNGDAVFNPLVDAVALLNFGFLGGSAPPCLEAADADNDTTLNALSDTVFMLAHGFLGGPAPAAPHPMCGSDPDPATSLGCEAPVCP